MRNELVAAVVTKLQGANLGEGVTIEAYSGDDRLFNDSAAFPYVGVAYAGGSFGASQEWGATTYRADYALEVAVATKDAAVDTGDGQTAALALLDAIEAALHNQTLSGLGTGDAVLEVVGEELVEAWQGRFLFVQRFRFQPLVTR